MNKKIRKVKKRWFNNKKIKQIKKWNDKYNLITK